MLDHDWVRKLMFRCGSRLGASRSAMRRTPPRLGCCASAPGTRARPSKTRTTATTVWRRIMARPPLRSEREAVELGDVAARDPEPVVRAGVLEVARDDNLRVGPRRGLVRIVGGPHELVDADEVAVGDPDVVVDVGAIHLALEVLAGLPGELEAGRVATALEGAVHPLQVVRQPAAVVLRRDDLQIWEAVE